MKKSILKTLSIICGVLIFIFLIVWFVGELTISNYDLRENKERAEHFYKEVSGKYKTSNGYPFEMNYTYDKKENLGFFSGGGYIGINCWERYIRDAWSNKEILSVSLCVDEKITKEKLEALDEFWKSYEKIFKK